VGRECGGGKSCIWGRDLAAEELFASAAAQLSLRGLPVAKDAKIVRDGKEVPLKDLPTGINLSIKFGKGEPVVTAIEATTPPRAGYVVKEVDAAKNTVTVTHGKDDKPLVLAVAKEAFFTSGSTLKDLKSGTHVALHVEIKDGKMIVTDLRVR
jgi:Cu/Ag efflux protein CusF